MKNLWHVSGLFFSQGGCVLFQNAETASDVPDVVPEVETPNCSQQAEQVFRMTITSSESTCPLARQCAERNVQTCNTPFAQNINSVLNGILGREELPEDVKSLLNSDTDTPLDAIAPEELKVEDQIKIQSFASESDNVHESQEQLEVPSREAFLKNINDYRSGMAQGPLELNQDLSDLAQQQSDSLAAEGKWHTKDRSERRTQAMAALDGTNAIESTSWGQTVDEAFQILTSHTGHTTAMIQSLTHVGVAFTKGKAPDGSGREGYYFTIIYVDAPSKTDDPSAPAKTVDADTPEQARSESITPISGEPLKNDQQVIEDESVANNGEESDSNTTLEEELPINESSELEDDSSPENQVDESTSEMGHNETDSEDTSVDTQENDTENTDQ